MKNHSLKEVLYVGLGKMGRNMVARLVEKGWRVIAFDASEASRNEASRSFQAQGSKQVLVSSSLQEGVRALQQKPRTVWLMVPHTAVESVLDVLIPLLEEGDTVIDGGNSFFRNSQRHAKRLQEHGITFLDVGVSGGPRGAREGACVMVGGSKEAFEEHETLFQDIAVEGGYRYFGASGAGHFIKMVHNGIEYGMMQAIAEGLTVIKKSEFPVSLAEVADLYQHRSVIESRLVGWMHEALKYYGEDLKGVSGKVSHSGEGLWTVETAKELGVEVPVIEESLAFRLRSQEKPSFTGKLLSALRNAFGGHAVREEDEKDSGRKK